MRLLPAIELKVIMVLEILFRSKVLVKILDYFMKDPGAKAYLREISREVNEPASAVRRELDRLTEFGLLYSETKGNHKYFQLQEGLPILPELKGLFLKTEGVAEYLRNGLGRIDGVMLAFVYGGFAKKQDSIVPEVDIAVIGLPDKNELGRLARNARAKIGRKVSFTCFEPDEFRRLLEEKDPSLSKMLGGDKVVLVANISEKS